MEKQIVNYVNEAVEKTRLNEVEQIEKALKENGWINMESTPSFAEKAICWICCAPGCAICNVNNA